MTKDLSVLPLQDFLKSIKAQMFSLSKYTHKCNQWKEFLETHA